MKRKKIILSVLVLIILLSIVSRGGSGAREEKSQATTIEETSASQNEESTPASEETQAEIIETVALESKDSTPASEEAKAKDTEADTSESEESIPAFLDSLVYFGSVHDDTTGNWRYAMIPTSAPITDYALDYYNTYFDSDNEIHFIINVSLNTTNRITLLMSNILDVTVLEYQDGEEHYADTLGSGDVLGEYWIYIDTGEIEEIS